MVLVGSPLISLMEDQVANCSSLGLSTALWDHNPETRKSIKNGEIEVIFTSPEALFSSSHWLNILSSEIFQDYLVGFIIDEAHCVRNWHY